MFKTRLLSGIVLVIILIATVGTGGGLLFGFLALISLVLNMITPPLLRHTGDLCGYTYQLL